MNRFKKKPLPISGLIEIQQIPIIDNRGFFSRVFSVDEFIEFGFTNKITQINHSFTKEEGSIRGMHFQHQPVSETKFVTCLKGSVYDVAVDIREDSPTFLKWNAVILSAKLHNSIMIPKGFAHGFQTLVDDVELLYLHDNYYQKEFESGLRPNDPYLKINWPKKTKLLSERDQNFPLIDSETFSGV
tara:strand:+ start:5271 stop:5828 length:558 start_codon:yes stop_codon:yes gene_type:complete